MKLLSYDEAVALMVGQAMPLPARRVGLHEALNTVLRGDIKADRDQPPFDRSAMDGFAVRDEEIATGRGFQVAGTIAAGAPIPVFPTGGNAVMRIATGAAAPPGANAVVPIEQAQTEGSSDVERVRFTIAKVEPWANLHRRGSDAKAGDVVIPAGTRLRAQHLGIAATVGATELEVSQPPRITLLTTGDEVRPPDTPSNTLEPQQIRNSNGPVLRGLLASLGIALVDHRHIVDEPEQTLAAAREAISRSHLVVTVGGVSVGQRDLLPWAWNRLGLETVLHGVAIQPGRPLFVARDENKLVIGLPGNPVSVLATAHLFLWPVLRKMLGEPAALPWRDVVLANDVKPKPKLEVFRAARLTPRGQAEVIHWHGSGDLMHTAGADGFVRLPRGEQSLQPGQVVPFLPLIA